MNLRERALLSLPIHSFFEALRYVGMRDRLRCPECASVGTFKPHGSILDREDTRHVRRWLCKWCGYYLGPEGRMQAFMDVERREWRLPGQTGSRSTPASIIRNSRLPNAWPWRG